MNKMSVHLAAPNHMRIILGFILAFAMAAGVTADQFHTKAELIVPVESARAGETVTVGVRLKMEPKWHTYWVNAGDAGGPTEIEWQLPADITPGAIQWPTPERYDAEGLTTFVYQDEVTLLVPLKLDANLASGPVELKANVAWLECADLCQPGNAPVTATLNIGSEAKPSPQAQFIETAKQHLPQTTSPAGLSAAWEGPATTNNTRSLILEWPANGSTKADFFPLPNEDYEVQFTPERLPVDASRIALRLDIKAESGKWPQTVRGLIVQTVGGKRQACDVSLKPEIVDAATKTGSTAAATSNGSQVPSLGAAQALLLALLGGMILNLMPCVLPILSLKVLHIVNQHGAPLSDARKHAFVYLLGVLVSFWSLAGLVIAGRLATWGEQFQDPRFIVIMAVLMTLIGLNLFGVFEILLPGTAANKASELSAKEGVAGSFFTGAMSVVLGASCVAPLLAAAIGWSIAQTPLMILLAFSMIGLGLALPFVLISFVPPLQKLLPKPGAWMEKFKTAMGFPMLATAVWLLSQTSDHFGNRGPLWLGIFLVLLGIAAWVYGEFHQRGNKRRGLSAVIAMVILGSAYVWALEHELNWRNSPAHGPGISSATTTKSENGIAWEPWSTQAVAKARAEGRPMLVDFTANWCLNCQLNKKTSLEIDSVRAKLKEINAVALLGDYTRKNPEISAELKRFERAGVPLVLVYPKDTSKPPKILPTILTPEIVLNALAEAAQ